MRKGSNSLEPFIFYVKDEIITEKYLTKENVSVKMFLNLRKESAL
jgi:hypothetical protein